MKCKKLLASNIIDPETEVHYALNTSLTTFSGKHCHDFYEFFLITKGHLIHIVNKTRTCLKEGALVFIRPFDSHLFQYDESIQYFEFINIAFPEKTFDALLEFLGGSFNSDILREAPMPPVIHLAVYEKEVLKSRLDKMNTIPYNLKSQIQYQFKVLLAELVTKYYVLNQGDNDSEIPLWLQSLIREMNNKSHFVEGVKKMVSLSDRSHEHLARVFRQYLNKTPTEFTNDLRLNYAVNLIKNTDKSILNIAMEAGFNNLSHFNHKFKEKFKQTPMNFRKDEGRDSLGLY